MEIEREREPGDVETKHSNNKNRDRIESQYLFIPGSHVIQLLTKIPDKICPEQTQEMSHSGWCRLMKAAIC